MHTSNPNKRWPINTIFPSILAIRSWFCLRSLNSFGRGYHRCVRTMNRSPTKLASLVFEIDDPA
jgi:hypothetical protein